MLEFQCGHHATYAGLELGNLSWGETMWKENNLLGAKGEKGIKFPTIFEVTFYKFFGFFICVRACVVGVGVVLFSSPKNTLEFMVKWAPQEDY